MALAVAAPAADDSCRVPDAPRVVAVGDVHGSYDNLVTILRFAGLVDAKDKWAGGKAHLVQTGDLLDRGTDGRKVLDLL
ncbi:MAG TPA: metallophosphoesterase, partial [Vicinamibacteria bacterium]|nr:metallophosphoesterase [Vicinamibacteria bacterium]